MWNYLLLVALVQGITEFLPISSSAHLILLPGLTGQQDQGLTIDVAAHLGTLIAVMLYFWRDLRQLLIDAVSLKWNRGLLIHLIVASVPIVIAGFLLESIVANELRSAAVIATTTIVFGVLLYVADRRPSDRHIEAMSLGHAFWIGLAQVLALIPGTSRSGITMTAGRALQYDRPGSAKFSMLLGIPTILGASTLMLWKMQKEGSWELGLDAVVVAGVSFIVALVAIAALMRWLQRSSLTPFVIYRLLLGVALIAWINWP